MTKENILRNKKLFILDMDGTVYLGNSLLDGSLDFLQKVKETNRKYMFFTNNSSRSSKYYIEKLNNLGITIYNKEISTSGDITIEFLKRNHKNKKVYLLGTQSLKDSFLDANIQLTDKNPDIFVLGFDTTINYEKLTKACAFVRNGVPFYATHPDYNCPVPEGFIPDIGAMIAFITASTNIHPRVFGKPYKETIEGIMTISGVDKKDLVFIGDRLYTDIAIAVNNQVTSVLVLTGETKKEDVKNSEIKPDIIVPSLKELINLL